MVGGPQAVLRAVLVPCSDNGSVHRIDEIRSFRPGQRRAHPDVVDALVEPRHRIHQQIRLAAGVARIRRTVAHRPGVQITVAGHHGVRCRTESERVEIRRQQADGFRAVRRVGIQVANHHDNFVADDSRKPVQDLCQLPCLNRLEEVRGGVAADFQVRVHETVTAPVQVDVHDVVAAHENDLAAGDRHGQVEREIVAVAERHVQVGPSQRDIPVGQPGIEEGEGTVQQAQIGDRQFHVPVDDHGSDFVRQAACSQFGE